MRQGVLCLLFQSIESFEYLLYSPAFCSKSNLLHRTSAVEFSFYLTKSAAMKSYDELQEKRSVFNSFNDVTARQAHGLNREEEDNLGLGGIAERIADPVIRRKYCALAIAMLLANINYHKPLATNMSVPGELPPWVVVSTLSISAFAFQVQGTATALWVAAGWYWFATTIASRRRGEKAKEMVEHNAHVPEWQATIEGWRKMIARLESAGGDQPSIPVDSEAGH